MGSSDEYEYEQGVLGRVSAPITGAHRNLKKTAEVEADMERPVQFSGALFFVGSDAVSL